MSSPMLPHLIFRRILFFCNKGILDISPGMWLSIWRFRSILFENPWPHSWQRNDFSPRWILRCWTNDILLFELGVTFRTFERRLLCMYDFLYVPAKNTSTHIVYYIRYKYMVSRQYGLPCDKPRPCSTRKSLLTNCHMWMVSHRYGLWHVLSKRIVLWSVYCIRCIQMVSHQCGSLRE